MTVSHRVGADPEQLGREGSYKLISGLVVPRPIGWIGTRGTNGVPNLAPYSFFNVVAGWPPTVMFSGGSVEGRPKDSPANAVATGAFTVNIVSEDLAEVMNASSATVSSDVDEFALVGLTPEWGQVVDAPMVAEARASLECKVTQVVEVGANTVVFGEVVRFHHDPEAVVGTRVDLDVLLPIGRMSGPGYTRTRDRFSMQRPD